MNATSTRPPARLAGLLYLVPTLVAPFGMMVVPATLLAPGDAAGTAARLVAHAGLARAGVVADLAVAVAEVALSAVLYALLAPAGRTAALAASFARLAMATLQAANVLPVLVALGLAGGGGAADLVALRLMEAHGAFAHAWEVLFALHCAIAGALVARSGYLPRALGGLLGVAAAGYAASGLGTLAWPAAAPALQAIVGVAAIVGELPLVVWLVWRGADARRFEEAAARG